MARKTITTSVVVNRPPEDVFAYLADFSRHHEWSPRPYRVQRIGDTPMGVGARFHSEGYIPRDPKHANDVEITGYEPPARLAFESEEKSQKFFNEFTLTPQDGATRVVRTLDMPSPGGFAGLMMPLLASGYIKPTVQKGMNMLKANLEKSA
jgi:uncharacterized protein YndB with AHSA1/START domain